MAKTAKVNVEFNTNASIITAQLQKLGQVSKETKAGVDVLAHSLHAFTLAKNGVMTVAGTLKSFGGAIVAVNSDFENLKTSLTGLISVSHSSVSSIGRVLGVQEKWALSTKKADATLQSLNEIASKTSFSLDQTAQMFKAFYSTASGNMSLDQSVKAFEGLANMASVVGISVDQAVRTLDGVGAGKWTSSELTRFLEGNLGLTKEIAQEAIKSGTYYELLISKLGEFSSMTSKTSNTYEASVAALKSEVESLVRTLSVPMFDGLKDGINEANKFLKDNRELIVGVANTAVTLTKHLGILVTAYYTAQTATSLYTKASLAMANHALFGSAALSKKTKMLGGLSLALDGVKKSVTVLKGAFVSFLPTAGIYLAYEAIMYFAGGLNKAKEASDDLKKTLTKTNDEIKKMTDNQRASEILGLEKTYNVLQSEYAKLEHKIRVGTLGVFKTGKDELVNAKAKLDTLAQQMKQTQEQISRFKNFANLSNDEVLESKGSTDDSGQDAIDKTRELNSALLEISRVGMSEYQLKLSQIDEQYKRWLGAGVDAKTALSTKEKLISEAQREQTQKLLNARSEIYKEYYEQIGDYAKSWETKQSEITKKLTEAGLSGDEFQKMLGFYKDSFIKKQEEANRQKAIEAINEELKLQDRVYELKKRGTELILDKTTKRITLINIEHAHAKEQYDAMLRKGEITQEYYNTAMALEEQLYQKQMFDASSWGQVMQSGLNSIENAMGSFFDYSSDRFMKFGDLARSILSDIANQMMKILVIQPFVNALGQGITNYFGGGASGASLPSGGFSQVLNSSGYRAGSGLFAGTSFAAKGNVFSSPDLHRYVNSVVSKPTFFAFAKGGVPSLGVMGEKNGGSPEAIMPLTRTSNGDLGVKAEVASTPNNMRIEIINQTREDAQVTNVSSRQNLEEQVISIVIGAVRTNKGGMRDIVTGGGR